MNIAYGKIENPYSETDLSKAYERGYRDGERNALRNVLKSLKKGNTITENTPDRGEEEV